jgi:sporulation transcriptional regulator SpoIIID
MKDYIEERVLEIAKYILKTNATVREAAKVFGVSKSTVHKDVTERLESINPLIYEDVKKVLEKNKAERHIRGGRATHIKYKVERKDGVSLP